MQLQKKILLWLLPLIILPIVLAGILAFHYVFEFTYESASKKFYVLIKQVDKQLLNRINRAERNLLLLSNNSLVVNYMLSSEENRSHMLEVPVFRLFKNHRKSFPEYLEISIVLPNGHKDLTTPNSNHVIGEQAFSQSAFFQKLQARTKESVLANRAVSIIQLHPKTGQPVLFSGVPLYILDPKLDAYDTQAKLRGYLYIAQELSFLNNISKDPFSDLFPELIISDRNGQISFGTQDFNHAFAQLALGKFLKSEGAEVLKIDHLGASNLVKVHQVSEHVYLIGLLPEKSLRHFVTKLTRMVSILTLIIILTTGVTLFISIQFMVTNPLNKLSSLTRAIANGNLDLKIDINQNDEVGDLAKSFSEMQKSLNKSKMEIEKLAYFDTLTGLPNKFTFLDQVTSYIKMVKKTQKIFSLIFFDLDNFKHINDSLGHQVGDLLLSQVSDRLRKCVKLTNSIVPLNFKPHMESELLLARMGGDEFTLLVTGLDKPEDCEKIALKIKDAFSQSFLVEVHEIFVSASIGIASYPKDGTSFELLLKHADAAMYEAKAKGKNTIQHFEEAMDINVSKRVLIENKMRSALENKRFFLHYQPKVPIDGDKVYEFEALIRWKDLEQGFIDPDTFIPIAEETRLIHDIGEWVLDAACKQIKEWNRQGFHDVRVSVNLSPVQFNYGTPVALIMRTLSKYQVSPNSLEVEITESGLMKNEAKAKSILEELNQLGVKIAIDDFGTGYSSLAALKRFPIDILKIDRSFIQDLKLGADSAHILQSILYLANSLNLKTVAEGVETQLQLDILRDSYCQTVQGNYFAKPTSASDAMSFFIKYYSWFETLEEEQQL